MAQQIQTSMVDIDSNGSTVPGYLCRPSGDGASPGVIVLQEWWGLEPHIKDIAERYARAGYVALATDLYHGNVTAEPDEARKLAMGMDKERAIKEIASSVRYLKAQSYVNGKVGTVGYCMGGGLSIAAACNIEEVDAAVIYYGGSPSDEDLAKVRVPVLGLYGGADGGVPVTTASALSEALEKNGTPYEIHIYGGAPHAFFNDTRESYREEAANDSWERTLTFFQKNLS
ncbi:MAG: dienelactone hydrolase family protein [Chloroflexi bacterium]|nr:dienelactone hydrolase family protein [Chloroflexota bacterium]